MISVFKITGFYLFLGALDEVNESVKGVEESIRKLVKHLNV